MLHGSCWYSHPFCYESTRRPTIFLQNIGYISNVFTCSCHYWSSTSPLITNQLSPFWKRVLPTKHCGTMYSRLTINFSSHLKCCCGIETIFPAKTNCCILFNCFFHYDLWHGQNRQVTSHRQYVPHCEQFELKLGMRREEGILTLLQVLWRSCY